MLALFVPEKRSIRKYERENIRITDKHVDDIMKWITPRDIELLKILLHHHFLTIDQIEMMVFNNLKPSSWRNKATERLRRLYHSHCIDRFFPPAEKDCGSLSQVVMLDYAGAKVLAKNAGRTEKFKWRKRDYIPQHYRHYLKIMDFKALLYVLNRQLGFTDEGTYGEILNWSTERIYKYPFADAGKVKIAKIIPDAFCIYKYHPQGKVKFFFLECDNATEPIEVIKSKLLNYKRWYESNEWRTERWAKAFKVFPAVLFVFHAEELAMEMAEYSKTIKSNIRFYFTDYKSLLEDDYKEYGSKSGKRRLVLQERKIKILDEIWKSKEGPVSL